MHDNHGFWPEQHVVFGEVVSGIEVVQSLAHVDCNPRDNRPFDPVWKSHSTNSSPLTIKFQSISTFQIFTSPSV
jgi:cyclophilin family peptidyl-prolyl cis-trans isomerase